MTCCCAERSRLLDSTPTTPELTVKTQIHTQCSLLSNDDDDDDDEGRINFSVALSPKTTRTRNNKLKQ